MTECHCEFYSICSAWFTDFKKKKTNNSISNRKEKIIKKTLGF